MKITKLELLKVKPRWMFLKMHTDTDLVGLGEPILEGHALAVEAVIREFEEYLIGKWEFRPFLEKQALAVVQPDLCRCPRRADKRVCLPNKNAG